jgi:hypothetical protein
MADVDREAAEERMKLARNLGYAFKEVKTGYYQFFFAAADEVRFSNALIERVAREYRDSPMLFAKCVGVNVFNLWFAGKSWRSTHMNVVAQLPYLVLATVGMILAIRERQTGTIAPLALLIGSHVVVYVPVLAQARYSVPLVPFLAILGCITLVAARGRLPGWWRGRRQAAA